MNIVVGLGNDGKKYNHTYHNVGFDCLDVLSGGATFKDESFLHSSIAKIGETIFVKPTTFMNDSGRALRFVMKYYKVPLNQVIVIHDDSDIDLGKYKIQTDRGSGGHNGVQSIIQECGGKDMTRVRIGIRAERFGSQKALSFVLQSIESGDSLTLDEVYAEVEKWYGELG